MTLNEEVRNAIQKNLPATVADELKEFIKDSQSRDIELDRLKERYDKLGKEYTELSAENAMNAGFAAKLMTRAEEFDVSEAKVRAATIAQAIAIAKLEGAMEVTRLVFSNNTIKRTVQSFGSIPVTGQNGYVQTGASTETRTETTEG